MIIVVGDKPSSVEINAGGCIGDPFKTAAALIRQLQLAVSVYEASMYIMSMSATAIRHHPQSALHAKSMASYVGQNMY